MKAALLSLSVVAMLSHAGVATAADIPPWSLDPDQLRIPDAPLQGRMPGCPDFKPTPPTLGGTSNTLSFEMKDDQSAAVPASYRDSFTIQVRDRRIKLGPGLEGMRLKVAPLAASNASKPIGSDATSVSMNWRLDDGSRSGNDQFIYNFSMVLEFGALTDGRMPIGIYLCLPDEGKSVVAGRFVITGSKDDPLGLSSIVGTLELPPTINEKVVFVGYVGPTTEGPLSSDGFGMDVPESGDFGNHTHQNGSMVVNIKKARKGDYTLTNPRPGWHLVLLAAAERETPKPVANPQPSNFPPFMAEQSPLIPLARVYAAHWVEVKDLKSTVECSLHLDPSLQGSVKVQVPGAREGTVVTFLPLTALGSIPVPAAHGVSPYLRARIKNGATPTLSLVEGSYEFTCLGKNQSLKVERGKTKTIKFEL